ncbi:glutathione S-transferase omega-1-like [Girardinichthys multiradiatus]|uniref:glutathione S-transferase omega-1-like n=1 Tax=Girardinichthys multiradiatus TaxID=208333 RepID=UPI001FACDE9D|nr:glutathione S-transferase omega-1-like [Girardinichthys multiradiatus]
MATEKCFAKGSPSPGPVPKDRLRLYSMRFCPFAQRTRLVLEAKGIKHDTINIHLKEKPDWFLEKNPLGLVPTLETPAGEVIYESPITCEYLDEAYPEKKLLPSSPFGKAQQRMMLEHFSKVIPYFYKIPTARRNGEDVSGQEAELKEKFAKLNEHLEKKKTKFFEGDTITMIDYMMWPFFERIEVLELKHCLDHTPELKKWTEHMLEDPAVKNTMFSMGTYKAFYKSVAEGKPDYDYGL